MKYYGFLPRYGGHTGNIFEVEVICYFPWRPICFLPWNLHLNIWQNAKNRNLLVPVLLQDGCYFFKRRKPLGFDTKVHVLQKLLGDLKNRNIFKAAQLFSDTTFYIKNMARQHVEPSPPNHHPSILSTKTIQILKIPALD